jgi:hypothetical protein
MKFIQKTSEFTPFILSEYERRPLLLAEDVYKLIYQATMGTGHLIECQRAAEYLNKEYKEVLPDENQELFEEISPFGLKRINLRRAKAEGISEETILEAFIDVS